jgi:hypothetical protein
MVGCWEKIVATSGYYSVKMGFTKHAAELSTIHHTDQHCEILMLSPLVAAWIAVAKTKNLDGIAQCVNNKIVNLPNTWLTLAEEIKNNGPVLIEVWRRRSFRFWQVA